jgi:serine phosphatase RsbU (regulator of sigma subunit)/Tfp pilus assembly protein PilF
MTNELTTVPIDDFLDGLPAEPVARLEAIAERIALRHMDPQPYLQLGREGYLLAEELGRADIAAHCLMGLAKGHTLIGDYGIASDLYRQAEQLLEGLGDREGVAKARLGLGAVILQQGDYAGGTRIVQESIALSRDARIRETELAALKLIGLAYQSMGDYDQAISSLLQALALEEEHRKPPGVAEVNMYLASISAGLGDNTRALEFIRGSLDYYRATGDVTRLPSCLSRIGDIHLALDDHAAALESYREAISLLERVPLPGVESSVLVGLGRVHLKMGDLESASEVMMRNLRLMQSTANEADEVEVWFDLSQLYMRQGKHDEAFDALSRTLAMAEESGLRPMLAEVHQLFSEYYEGQGDPVRALEHYREYHRIDSEVSSGETGRKLQRMQAQLELEKQSAAMRLKSERMEHELELARQVQQSLLPAAPPEIAGLDVAAVCVPALEVGGDYYDYFRTGERSLGIAIGDVSGKGLPAAIYMTLIKGVIRSHALPGIEPNELLTSVNHHLHEIFSRGKFASMIYATIDLERMELRYASAGQNPPLLIHDRQRISPERTEGMALGLARSETFAPPLVGYLHPLRRGDTIVFYTDGFSEAMNEGREEYGDEQLIESALRHSVLPDARRVLEAVGSDVEHFTGSAPRHNDMTMIVVKIR